MRVALDFDNTLADTNSLTVVLMNFKHDLTLRHEDVRSWDWFADQGLGDTFWQIYDLYDNTYLRRAMPPTSPFASAVIKWMTSRGHEVDVVTMNEEESLGAIEAWVFMQGIDAPVKTMGRVSPGEKIKMDYDIFIDDSPKLIEPVREEPSKILILYTQPWNEDIDVSAVPNIVRCNTWLDILYALRRLGI